jgi:hypothetical protein
LWIPPRPPRPWTPSGVLSISGLPPGAHAHRPVYRGFRPLGVRHRRGHQRLIRQRSPALSDSATWLNATISSLFLTPATYTYTWGAGATADSLTVQVGAATSNVPEPATIALLAAALLALAAVRRRRRICFKTLDGVA